MIRYADERFVNIELILEDESGLKIPKTSVTEKDCYAVPIDYITSGGASQNEGVYRQTTKKGKTTTEFIPVTIINEDTESGIAYLDTENLKKEILFCCRNLPIRWIFENRKHQRSL